MTLKAENWRNVSVDRVVSHFLSEMKAQAKRRSISIDDPSYNVRNFFSLLELRSDLLPVHLFGCTWYEANLDWESFVGLRTVSAETWRQLLGNQLKVASILKTARIRQQHQRAEEARKKIIELADSLGVDWHLTDFKPIVVVHSDEYAEILDGCHRACAVLLHGMNDKEFPSIQAYIGLKLIYCRGLQVRAYSELRRILGG